jgi:hypothetical protein
MSKYSLELLEEDSFTVHHHLLLVSMSLKLLAIFPFPPKKLPIFAKKAVKIVV